MSKCTTKLNHVRVSHEAVCYLPRKARPEVSKHETTSEPPIEDGYRTACGRWLSIRDQYPQGTQCATCKKYWETKRKEEDFWMEPLLSLSITIEGD